MILIIILILIYIFSLKKKKEHLSDEQAKLLAELRNLSAKQNRDRLHGIVYMNKDKIKKILITSKNFGDRNIPIPKGTIIAFGGDTIPDGWVLCDGNKENETKYKIKIPDLRNKFILCEGENYKKNESKNGHIKLNKNNLPKHSHKFNYFKFLTSGNGHHHAFKAFAYDGRDQKMHLNKSGGDGWEIPYYTLTYIIKI
jgi:hypothetical protein